MNLLPMSNQNCFYGTILNDMYALSAPVLLNPYRSSVPDQKCMSERNTKLTYTGPDIYNQKQSGTCNTGPPLQGGWSLARLASQ